MDRCDCDPRLEVRLQCTVATGSAATRASTATLGREVDSVQYACATDAGSTVILSRTQEPCAGACGCFFVFDKSRAVPAPRIPTVTLNEIACRPSTAQSYHLIDRVLVSLVFRKRPRKRSPSSVPWRSRVHLLTKCFLVNRRHSSKGAGERMTRLGATSEILTCSVRWRSHVRLLTKCFLVNRRPS